MHKKTIVYVLLLLTSVFLAACEKHQKSEKVIIGKIWTGDSNMPFAEAMAIDGENILKTGTREEIEEFIGPQTTVHEYENGIITPGFIDSHVHFLMGGFRLSSVQLRDADSREKFINRIAEYARQQPAGTWITGGDWDHTLWGGELPDRKWIDSVTADHPVWVTRLDGHMSLANSKALEAAGIDNSVENLEGGMIVRDNGRITGIFKDNAANLIWNKMPEETEDQKIAALQTAMNYVLSKGVTSVHDVSANLSIYEQMRTSNQLKVRVYAIVPLSEWNLLAEYVEENGKGDEWLRVGGLKGFVDGSLGSHTAAFFDPYTDKPDDSGLIVTPEEELYNRISSADSAGLQVMIHAIGDRAINLLLNIYAQVEQENGEKDRRFRIEHAQHIAPNDIPRFAEQSVIPSMQPYHAIDDGRWAEELIGPERIETTYAFHSLFESGASPAFGSDWFVAPPTPLEGIFAAVTRRTLDGKNPEGWVPEQKITVEQALTGYTKNAAYAGFSEDKRGILKAGMLADFVVIDSDLFSIEPEEIRNAKILETWVGGNRMYSQK